MKRILAHLAFYATDMLLATVAFVFGFGLHVQSYVLLLAPGVFGRWIVHIGHGLLWKRWAEQEAAK